jgi:hypothetical protein
MKSFWLGLALLLCLAPALGGNRADVNADQVVNAADTVLLANIVAGNLDVANYDLETVVVVAPQGGDFTNPADAADWIQTQSPGPTHRFVILVTPGEYTIDHAIILIGYTTLQGYGPKASRIVANMGASSYVIRAMDCDQVAVRDLAVYLQLSSMGSPTILVDITNCNGCLLEGLELATDNTETYNRWLNASNSTGDCRNVEMTHGSSADFHEGIRLSGSQFNFDHCQVKLTGSESSEIVGMYLTGSMGVILRDCRVSVTNNATGFGATALKVESPQSYAVFRDCHLQAVSSSPAGQNNFYFISDSTTHTVRFFHCQLDGNAILGGAAVVRFGCSTSLGVAVP